MTMMLDSQRGSELFLSYVRPRQLWTRYWSQLYRNFDDLVTGDREPLPGPPGTTL